ncbi:hypothetical protein PFICI_02141 [Pestalotiopsis fici W106-1]|uniref:Uncharacterized protein n=1 Tax=Pestalotiopsis fici (strain W106-1 / CGMCC3.15140) TaxID=1229662 RepID=W3XFY2_PESFW|nr:uncharacterized protein PFICI_02141 [Pestalotiopsis fici W106-1]ETS84116.1 hypothetical protein PFICI_02141 [Pestalotiopsis fici W106-1]
MVRKQVSRFASSAEIQAYLKRVAQTFNLDRYIQYNTRVTHASWCEESATWTVELNGQHRVQSEILVNAGGILNDPQIPEIPGLSSFAGPRLHTAAWDPSVDITGRRVAVIGAGASAIQLIPQIQPLASHVDVYIRTPSWITPPIGLEETAPSPNPFYTEQEKYRFKKDASYYLHLRKGLEAQFNGMFRAFMKGTPEQKALRADLEENMKTLIRTPALQEQLIPKFEAGCRRMNPGQPYIHSLQEDNVLPVFGGVDSITSQGVVVDGTERACDILVLATGFNTSFRPRFPIIGRNGVDLQRLWSETPTSYMGTGVAGFPNYLIYLGPNTPISNGSLMGSLEATSDYFIRLLRKVIRQRVKAFDVRPEAQQDFDDHTQSIMRDMVWTGTCRSWFKKGVDGKVTALWPGSSLHYMQTLAENRWEDYNWDHAAERFSYWGNGISWTEDPNADKLGVEERSSMLESTTVPGSSGDISYYLWASDPLNSASVGSISESVTEDAFARKSEEWSKMQKSVAVEITVPV